MLPRPAASSPTRRASRWTSALTCALLACGCASTQDASDDWTLEPTVGEGGRVFGFSGSYSYRGADEDREWFAARATVDEFVTDGQSVGGFALGRYANRSEDRDGEEQLWLGGHYRFHWHVDENASIYAGPAIGFAYFDDLTANGGAFAWGVSAGFRYWLTRRAAFTIEPTYLRAEFGSDEGGTADDLLLLWGFAFSL